MEGMETWHGQDLDQLRRIPLGVLRRGTVRRHGVTRWIRGARPDRLRPHEVRVIDLHPALLTPEWWPYACFVLHHELIHATGHRRHDAAFRRWESSWPSPAKEEGPRPSPRCCTWPLPDGGGRAPLRREACTTAPRQRALPLPQVRAGASGCARPGVVREAGPSCDGDGGILSLLWLLQASRWRTTCNIFMPGRG